MIGVAKNKLQALARPRRRHVFAPHWHGRLACLGQRRSCPRCCCCCCCMLAVAGVQVPAMPGCMVLAMSWQGRKTWETHKHQRTLQKQSWMDRWGRWGLDALLGLLLLHLGGAGPVAGHDCTSSRPGNGYPSHQGAEHHRNLPHAPQIGGAQCLGQKAWGQKHGIASSLGCVQPSQVAPACVGSASNVVRPRSNIF